MTDQDCDICCEKYNKSTHAKVKCEFGDCEYQSCKSCVRTYLLGTTADPHCMKCKKSWNEKFIVQNLNRTFCEKEYKNHRKQLLIDREMSRLPETMHLAERQKKADVEEKKNSELFIQITNLNKQVKELKHQRTIVSTNIYKIKHGQDKENERRKFVMTCPTDNCRGFLSTQYKCELCELFTCPDCHEIIGYSKTDPHECDPNNVASAEMIKKETKPCPSCGVRIFKISGCSQMWCTECKVAFDYNTGKLDTGIVHNPHYYAHMAQQNEGQAPRNPQDILCGGLISLHNLHHSTFNILRKNFTDIGQYNQLARYILAIHRTISHITYNDLPHFRMRVRDLDNSEDLRINYILGKINKKEIGDKVYRRDLQRKKYTELLHLYELISVHGIEIFNLILNIAHQQNSTLLFGEINKKITEINNLREYCNNEFIKISITYNNIVLCIDDEWRITSRKYKISDLKN